MHNSSSYESREAKNTENSGDEILLENNDNNSNGTASSILNNDEIDTNDAIVDDIEQKCGNDQVNSANNRSIASPLLPQLVEIKHLKRRIRNVQEISIQTSRDAIGSDLAKYQNNVLNATQGCVNEWRAIARFYQTTSEGEEGIPSILRTEVGLAVFLLIQLSVQCGPLSGGKPGYFKRCGTEVARVALEFLEEVVPKYNELGIDCMGFTSKQMDAMKKWKVNAQKAVENDKAPSRTAMKKMKQLQQKIEKQNIQKHNKIKKKKKKGII